MNRKRYTEIKLIKGIMEYDSECGNGSGSKRRYRKNSKGIDHRAYKKQLKNKMDKFDKNNNEEIE